MREEDARRAAAFDRWRQNPVEGARELGHDPDKVAADLARAGSPEAVFEARMKALEARLGEVTKPFEDRIKALDDRWNQAQEQAANQHRAGVEQAFVSAATPEQYPSTRALYETPEEILEAGRKVVAAIAKKSGGRATCTDRDILEYLEEQASAKLAKLRAGVAAVAPQGQGVAAQSQQAKGSRTLSAKGASERQGTASDLRDMSPSEQDEALKAAVRATRKR